MSRLDRNFDLVGLLVSAENAPPTAAVDVLTAALGERIGASRVSFLLMAHSGKDLVRLGGGHAAENPGASRGKRTPEKIALSDTVYDAVLRAQKPRVVADGDGARVVAPVTNRGDAMGLLELSLRDQPSEEVLDLVGAAAHALAYVVIANRRFTDLYEWRRRVTPFSLAAEIQHRLLPEGFTCEAAEFALAGGVEPAATIGGDTFDYILDTETLHVSITDAMGHGETAALLATLLVAALRNSRRRGATLEEQAEEANAALAGHSGAEQFVTGLVLRVELATGQAEMASAGHPLPLLWRDGEVHRLSLEQNLPFGMAAKERYRTHSVPLVPGDRVVLFTDGMVERNVDVDMESLLSATMSLHPREAVRQMLDAVSTRAGGSLRDDATVMCLDWHGGGQGRKTHAGAEIGTASPAPEPSA